MSTILKALKKLEERKAAEGRRQGDIAWDVLREEPRRSVSNRSGGLLLLGGVLIVLLVGLVVWTAWPPREGTAVDIEERSVPRPPITPSRDAGLVPPPPVAPRAQAPPVQARPAVDAPSAVSQPETAHLTVSGIAFHDDQESRMAIVNDLPVMTGTVIEGFVVERIETDRVEFSRQGERFVVPLIGDD